MVLKWILSVALLCAGIAAQAQDDARATYKNSIRGRIVKIVNSLEITDSLRYYRVVDRIGDQYFDINAIHDQYKSAVKSIKDHPSLSPAKAAKALAKKEKAKRAQLSRLHKQYISGLKKDLNDEQVEQVKNGMTYNVLNVTYDAYQDKIPSLTKVQKDKIYVWLLEARELAMDEGSSEDKHRVFGKYKGKINNYLSAEGYDLKKEEKAWQERLRLRRQKESK